MKSFQVDAQKVSFLLYAAMPQTVLHEYFSRMTKMKQVQTHIPGFPRIGAARELKFALERFWRGESSEAALQETASNLRAQHWSVQRQHGLDYVTVGDFALYDHVAD